MTSDAKRREEWKNRQNKGNNNEAWVKAIENGKAIIKGEELWDSNKFKNELRQHVINSTNIQKSKGALPKNTKNESLDELFKSG